MCDTVVSLRASENESSFFGKNSDREPGELQFIDVSVDPQKEFEEKSFYEKLSKYTEGPLVTLRKIFNKFEHPYKAILSRPVWMWGAEMGVNEKGLTIGNMKNLLRSHLSDSGVPGKSMSSICVHARGIVKSETTASMIVEYGKGSPSIWFTSSPYSCVSTYKPMVLEDAFSDDNPFIDKDYSISYAKEQMVNSYLFAGNYSKFTNEVAAHRNGLEKEFKSSVVDGKLDLQAVLKSEKAYLAKVKDFF